VSGMNDCLVDVQGHNKSVGKYMRFFRRAFEHHCCRRMIRWMQASCAVKLPYSVDDKRRTPYILSGIYIGCPTYIYIDLY
jgi:hypothetical protein